MCFEKAIQLYQKGNFKKSLLNAKKGLKKNPAEKRYYLLFGLIFYSKDKFNESIKNLNIFLKYDPKNVDALITKFHCLRVNKNYDEALLTLRSIELIDSRNSDIYFFYGECNLRMNKHEIAKNFFNKSIMYNESKRNFLNIFNTYESDDYFLEASEFLKKYKDFDNDAEIILRYCKTQFKFNSNNYIQVEKLLKKILSLDKNNTEILFWLGNCSVLLGKVDDATKNFLEVTSLDKGFETFSGAAYYQLSRLGFNITDSDMIFLEKKFHEINDAHNKIGLGIALSNFNFKKKNIQNSSKFLTKSNKLAKKFIVKNFMWSFESEQKIFDNYKKIYEFVKYNLKVKKKKNSCPIFILGLPRSGTSLVEKILSHSDIIEIKSESCFLTNEIKRIFPEINGKYINNIKDLNLNNLIDRFIEFISPQKPFFTEKTPHNFLLLGTLKFLLPKSKIILCERSIEENLFSMYQTLFNSYNHMFSYDLDDLYQYSKLYKNLINYWDQEKVEYLKVDYENLINSKEITINKICEFLGIKFNSKMLKPHLSSIQINTASIYQTQNPINSDSLTKYVKFKKYLDRDFCINNS